jgi:hypothetical protein
MQLAAAGHHDHDLEVPEMISLQEMKHGTFTKRYKILTSSQIRLIPLVGDFDCQSTYLTKLKRKKI